MSDTLPIRFQIYRIKLIRPHQAQLTADNLSAADLIRAAIADRPEQQTTFGTTWRIGNVVVIPDAAATSFAIGRTSRSTAEKFDENAKNFVEEPFESSPSTVCVVLVDLGVIAIAHKSRLAASTQAVASRVRKLLDLTDGVTRNGISVEVTPVPDPKSFIDALQSAYAVLAFTATFRGPNPIDADEIFQKPLAKIASVTSADGGRVKLQGSDLDREAVTEIARSTAATGNQASARLREEKLQRARTVPMGKAPAELVYPEDELSLAQVAIDLRKRYAEVRDG